MEKLKMHSPNIVQDNLQRIRQLFPGCVTEASGANGEAFVKELAKVQPLRVVFRDTGFKDSSVKINVEQIFKLLSPATEVKCI